MTVEAERRVYRFGEAEVDSAWAGVRLGDRTVDLRQRTFHVLLHLLRHPDRVVTREELLENLWKDVVVSEGAVGQCIVEIRRALGDDPKSPRYVKTYSKSGYRLVCPVEVTAPGALVPGGPQAVARLETPTVEITSVEVEIEEEIPDVVPAALPSLPGAGRTRGVWTSLALLLIVAAAGLGLAARRERSPDLRLPDTPGKTPLAVLFFENRSRSQDLDWLREGLADMVITDLSRSPKLTVLSRQQLRLALDGLGRDPDDDVDLTTALEVARRSRAGVLVVGAFQRLGDRVRVDAQLHDARSGRLLAAETTVAERPEQILTQVDLLALKLAERLGAPPSGDARQRLRTVRTDSLDAYRYYSLALEKAHALHNGEAIDLLSKAIALDPEFAMAHARTGYALAVTGGEAERARPHLAKALELSARLAGKDRREILAWDAIARLDFPAAIEDYRALLADFPGELELYMRLGKLLQGEERHEEAIEVLRQGLVVDPESRQLHNFLASVASELSRHDEAIAEAERYVALDPKEPNAYDTLASVHQRAGRYDEALAAYDRALSLNPDFGVAVIHLGNTYLELGRYRDALAVFQRYVDLGRTHGERARGLESAAWTQVLRGDVRAAEAAADAAMALEPGAAFPAWWLALRRGDHDRAARLAGLVAAPPRTTGRGQRSSLRRRDVVLGWQAIRSGRPEEGLKTLAGAVRHRPLTWSFDTHETALADACLELERLDAAVVEYERVLAINPRFPMALYRLALALERQGRPAESAKRLRQLLDVWKGADADVPELLDARRRLAALGTGRVAG